MSDKDLNSSVSALNAAINDIFSKVVPMSKGTTRHNTVPWYSSEIDAAIKIKDFSYGVWKNNRDSMHCDLFRSSYKTNFNKVKCLIKKAKRTVENDSQVWNFE